MHAVRAREVADRVSDASRNQCRGLDILNRRILLPYPRDLLSPLLSSERVRRPALRARRRSERRRLRDKSAKAVDPVASFLIGVLRDEVIGLIKASDRSMKVTACDLDIGDDDE